MTIDLEEQLTSGMRERVADAALPGDVLGKAMRHHHRRTAVIRMGYGLGVVGLAGVLAAGVTLSGGSHPGGGSPGGANPAVQALPASLRLANAATASDGISYRIKLTIGANATSNGVSQGAGFSQTFDGAFDPHAATGYVRTRNDAGVLTELLIDGTRYIGTERAEGTKPTGVHETYGRYGQYSGKYDQLSYGLQGNPVLSGVTADPASLFKALREANATVTDGPDGSLRFVYRQTSADGTTVTNGDVTLDGNGRIARVAITGTTETTAKGRLDRSEFTTTLDLSGYGLPVTVQRPADVVPAN